MTVINTSPAIHLNAVLPVGNAIRALQQRGIWLDEKVIATALSQADEAS